MVPPPRVGLLATLDGPLLGHIVRELATREVPIAAILVDAQSLTARDLALLEERTRPLAADPYTVLRQRPFDSRDLRSATQTDPMHRCAVVLM